MRGARHDQIAELTSGLILPLPPIAAIHLDVVIEMVQLAAAALITQYSGALLNKAENELNGLLQARLNVLREQNKTFGQLVACVVRGGEVTNFNGQKLEKRPDLAVYLTSRHANFPLLLECKIIDAADGKGVDLYCSKGIRRFVEGEYAWASGQSVMLAYVRDGSTVDGSLSPFLDAHTKKPPDPYKTEALPEPGNGGVSLSRHGRAFKYVEKRHGAPGAVAISHLWIEVPASAEA